MNKRRRLLGSFIGIFDDDDLPEDLSENRDKYLYGEDKKADDKSPADPGNPKSIKASRLRAGV